MLALALPNFPVSLGKWKRIYVAKLNIDIDTFTPEFEKTAQTV